MEGAAARLEEMKRAEGPGEAPTPEISASRRCLSWQGDGFANLRPQEPNWPQNCLQLLVTGGFEEWCLLLLRWRWCRNCEALKNYYWKLLPTATWGSFDEGQQQGTFHGGWRLQFSWHDLGRTTPGHRTPKNNPNTSV